MNTSSSNYPHEMCPGGESVTSNPNGFNSVPPILNSISLDFFFSEGKNSNSEVFNENIPGFSIRKTVHQSSLNEKNCRAFAPFGGTWDYSEVD